MRVGVIFGGHSVEHDISIISAVQVMNQIRYLWEVVPIYISKNNEIFVSKQFFSIDEFKKNKKRAKYHFVKGGVKRIFKKKLDFVFSVVHGKNVEDGSIKALLDFYEIPSSSSGLIPSAICQDKIILKDILKFNGIDVIDYRWFYNYEWFNNHKSVLKEIEELDYPVVVKPASLGSSIAIKVCNNQEELIDGIVVALKYDDKILIESYIEKVEYNISVMGKGDNVSVSGVEEINEKIYTFDKKYQNKFQRNKMVQDEEIQKLGSKVFKILGLSGVIRIDVFKGDKLYINEVNTIPGSLSNYLWDISNEEFYKKLISIGLEEDELVKSFESSVLQNQSNKMGKLL
ncbi:ATP-grasp domain-containing protein [Mycoplasmatota bacterium zrk1]